MHAPCANCGKIMWLGTDVAYITQFGLAHNICGQQCLQEYNNSDIDPNAKVRQVDASGKITDVQRPLETNLTRVES